MYAGLYQEEFLTNKELCSLVREQTAIGWDHFSMGHVSRQWRVQGPSLEYMKDPREWTKGPIREILNCCIKLWKFRNKLVHGSDAIASAAEERKLKILVEDCYTDIAPWALED